MFVLPTPTAWNALTDFGELRESIRLLPILHLSCLNVQTIIAWLPTSKKSPFDFRDVPKIYATSMSFVTNMVYSLSNVTLVTFVVYNCDCSISMDLYSSSSIALNVNNVSHIITGKTIQNVIVCIQFNSSSLSFAQFCLILVKKKLLKFYK